MLSHVDDATFASEVLESDRPVLVDAYATWCGPCRAIAPLIDQLAVEQEAVKVVKLDVDTAPKTASALGIRSVPTLLLFKGGVPVDRRTGAAGIAQLRAFATG